MQVQAKDQCNNLNLAQQAYQQVRGLQADLFDVSLFQASNGTSAASEIADRVSIGSQSRNAQSSQAPQQRRETTVDEKPQSQSRRAEYDDKQIRSERHEVEQRSTEQPQDDRYQTQARRSIHGAGQVDGEQIAKTQNGKLPLFKNAVVFERNAAPNQNAPGAVGAEGKVQSESGETVTAEKAGTANAQKLQSAKIATGSTQNPPIGETNASTTTGNVTSGTAIGDGLRPVGLSAASSASGTNSAQSTSLADRVAQVQELLSKTGGSITKLVRGGGGKMTLRLDPPSMGKLQVEVEIVKDVCTARVVAEDPAVKAALVKGLPQLREALEAQGLRLDGFSVESESSLGARHEGTAGQWDWNRGSYPPMGDPSAVHPDMDVKNTQVQNPLRPMMGRVDMHV